MIQPPIPERTDHLRAGGSPTHRRTTQVPGWITYAQVDNLCADGSPRGVHTVIHPHAGDPTTSTWSTHTQVIQPPARGPPTRGLSPPRGRSNGQHVAQPPARLSRQPAPPIASWRWLRRGVVEPSAPHRRQEDRRRAAAPRGRHRCAPGADEHLWPRSRSAFPPPSRLPTSRWRKPSARRA